MTLGRGLLLWLGLSTVGAVIVILPDDSSPLVSLSDGHGPSAVDTLGIVVLLIGWAGFIAPLVRERSRISHPRLLAAVAAVGAALVAWSIGTDAGAWWVLGVAMLVAAQVVAVHGVLRTHAPPTASSGAE